jgi:hypothetical protein
VLCELVIDIAVHITQCEPSQDKRENRLTMTDKRGGCKIAPLRDRRLACSCH